jgi:hypothetical protein
MPQSGRGQRVLQYPSLQFRVLGFGCFVDGNVGVGIFPEREKVSVSGKRVGSIRRCLICDGMSTSTQAADHGATPCYPHSEASDDSRTHNR